MKPGIHPTYYEDALVICACGNQWHTGSTKKEIHTDVCSDCHPFYTGEQRIVDTAGQVERFMKRQAAKGQFASKPSPVAPEEAQPAKKERRPRVRGDMRSGMRGRATEAAAETPAPEAATEQAAPIGAENETAEALPEKTAPTNAANEIAPEAVMIDETPRGFVVESVPVEAVEEPVATEVAGSEGIQDSVELNESAADAVLTQPEAVMESAAPVSESATESEARAPESFQTEAVGSPEAPAPEVGVSTPSDAWSDVSGAQPLATMTEVPISEAEAVIAPEATSPEAAGAETQTIEASAPETTAESSTEGRARKPRPPRKPRAKATPAAPTESGAAVPEEPSMTSSTDAELTPPAQTE